ncbi:MAG: antibiotic biosynthesis monooxygenase, partial [Polaromonas sp.]|nr:antibiotic biosynthesis monooxygenase [Polaromonas sp.]
ALATPGYLGAETWRSPDGARNNATYFWDNLEALRTFSAHPKHLEAKRQYTEWYKGFHIVISQVLRSYGDGTIAHITPNERNRSQGVPA